MLSLTFIAKHARPINKIISAMTVAVNIIVSHDLCSNLSMVFSGCIFSETLVSLMPDKHETCKSAG
jgi:hypothetical protein